MVRQEFELAYYDFTVQHINHNTIETPLDMINKYHLLLIFT